MKKIAIYCINYHSYDCLKDYLSSIEVASKKAVQTAEIYVFVADNSIPSEGVDFRSPYFRLEVFPTGSNLGYFGAAEYVMSRVPPADFDYTIISNVDVLLTEKTFIELSEIPYDSTYGWIAPSLYSQTYHFDWNPQATKRYSVKKLKIMRFLFKHPLLLRLKQIILHKYRHIDTYPSGDIYAGHGSFIILTKSFFNKCGIIHYPIFLYFEELFLAETCRKNQLKVVYLPQIHVLDIGGTSTGRIPSETYCKYNYEGIDYIISNYY